jgi:hypothetical protein
VDEAQRLQPHGGRGERERREVDGEVRLRQQQRAVEERQVRAHTSHQRALPEFGSLPSAGGFAECFLSGTRQSLVCREPHSANSCAR